MRHSRIGMPFLTGLVLSASIAVSGCGSPQGGADQLPTYDVTGKVTVDGQPLQAGSLVMKPTDTTKPTSGGEIQEDGTVKFSTYSAEGGIPEGEYEASVMMSMSNAKPVPAVVPLKVNITEDLDGGELPIAFEGTGKTQETLLPPTN